MHDYKIIFSKIMLIDFLVNTLYADLDWMKVF